MVAFTTKRITKSKTLGEKLREARLDRGLPLEKAAKDLNIAFKYLEALENNRLGDLPGKTYLKNYLRDYSCYLHLDFGELWDEAKISTQKEAKKFQAIHGRHFFVWSKFLSRLAAAFVIIILLVFIGWKISDIFRPPSLVISEPSDGYITSTSQIMLRGLSAKEAEITINNKAVFVDNQGKFEAAVDLQKGLNLIKISASKRYSREKDIILRILQTEQ